jgi:hypothetical protein
MPHVVLSGSISVAEIFDNLQKIMYRYPASNTIIRIEEYLVSKEANRLLARAIVVEQQQPRSFYIEVNVKDDKTTVRLDPMTDPEKTDGVKLALALMAQRIQEIGKLNNLSVSKTNISEFLDLVQQMR